ncbi:MAG: signal peptide peptidase SppA [Desulfobacteraceae bacterium]|nr:signal peptide peptidase SppA [Desulfobacteraceae bacterium]
MNRARLNLDHVQDTLWAIGDGKLDEISAVISSLLEGKALPAEFEMAREEQPASRAQDTGAGRKPYGIVVAGGPFQKQRTAIIPITGTLMKRANLFSEWSGGTSTQKVMGLIAKAVDDPEVDAIALDIDSPGGMVDGTKTLADFIHGLRGKKPIVAVSDGTIASAAYWIASAADSIHICETSTVGSIGVRLTHFDMSGRDKESGVVRTTIFAGRYKAIADDTGPLSKEGREYLQSMVDKTYAVFLADIARNRGVDPEAVLKMAEGRVFIGTDAVEAGLADGIGSLDTAIGRASHKKRRSTMDELEQVKAQLAEANGKIAQIEAEKTQAVSDAEAAKAEVALKAKNEEKLRREVARKGHEARIAALVSEGKIAPATVSAGLADFLMALDTLGEPAIGGKNVSPSEWFTANFLNSEIVSLGQHTAREESAAKSGADAEIRAGMEIAAVINKDIKLD